MVHPSNRVQGNLKTTALIGLDIRESEFYRRSFREL